MKTQIEKEVEKELNKYGAIRWGLATSLKYVETIKYICELKKEIELLKILNCKEGEIEIKQFPNGEVYSVIKNQEARNECTKWRMPDLRQRLHGANFMKLNKKEQNNDNNQPHYRKK